MSELREECYKCLNNQNCISGADYGSIYCIARRKFKMPENKDDEVYAIKFAVMKKQLDEKDKRIKELEEENKRKDMFLQIAKEVVENSIPKQKVKDYLKEEQERFEVYKKESETNENLKYGMWKHLGAKNMCEKILGIEKNIATLD